MGYKDKATQKEYHRLYYNKYIKKVPTNRILKIDLMHIKPKQLQDVRNPTLDHYTNPITFDTDKLF